MSTHVGHEGTILFLIIGVFIQKYIMATYDNFFISKIYLTLIILTTIVGIVVTIITHSATLTIFAKTLTEFSILLFYLRGFFNEFIKINSK